MPTKTRTPTPNELHVLATSLALRYAHKEVDIDDLVQEALIWAHNAFKRIPKPKKPFAYARTAMQCAMISFYKARLQQQSAAEEPITPQTEQHAACTNECRRIEDRLFLNQYFDAVESALGKDARGVAENLVEPEEATYCELIINEAAACGCRKIRQSQRALRQALGYSKGEWNGVMNALRKFTKAWLSLAGGKPTI